MTLSAPDIEKNICRILRQSIGEHTNATYDQSRAVFAYAANPKPTVSAILDGMGLLAVAEAVLAGATLEQVGIGTPLNSVHGPLEG